MVGFAQAGVRSMDRHQQAPMPATSTRAQSGWTAGEQAKESEMYRRQLLQRRRLTSITALT